MAYYKDYVRHNNLLSGDDDQPEMPVVPRDDTPETEEAAEQAADANQEAGKKVEEIMQEEPSFRKLTSSLNCLMPRVHPKGTRKKAMDKNTAKKKNTAKSLRESMT